MLTEKLHDLALARAYAVKIVETRKELEAAIEETPEYRVWNIAKNAASEASAEVDKLEAEIKALAIANFDGNKTPANGLVIKVFQVVTMDEKSAREWAFINYRPALKLDKTAIEKAAKDGTVPAEIATVTSENRAQLASDLSEYL